MEAIHRARSFGGDATVLADYALTTTTSVRPSVTLVDQDHIAWKSWKLIAGHLAQRAFALRRPKGIHLLPGEHGEILRRVEVESGKSGGVLKHKTDKYL